MKDFSYQGRVINFLRFKGIQKIENCKEIEIEKKYIPHTQEDSKKILRDIEETSPYPIGFIGPIESIFQWSSMILTAHDELSQEIVNSVLEQIEEKIEEEYFLMGPTFSVADCVLSSDLTEIKKKYTLSPLVQNYITRVETFLS